MSQEREKKGLGVQVYQSEAGSAMRRTSPHDDHHNANTPKTTPTHLQGGFAVELKDHVFEPRKVLAGSSSSCCNRAQALECTNTHVHSLVTAPHEDELHELALQRTRRHCTSQATATAMESLPAETPTDEEPAQPGVPPYLLM